MAPIHTDCNYASGIAIFFRDAHHRAFAIRCCSSSSQNAASCISPGIYKQGFAAEGRKKLLAHISVREERLPPRLKVRGLFNQGAITRCPSKISVPFHHQVAIFHVLALPRHIVMAPRLNSPQDSGGSGFKNTTRGSCVCKQRDISRKLCYARATCNF